MPFIPANNWAKRPGIHWQPTWPIQNYCSMVKSMSHYCTKADPSSPTSGAESSTQRQLSHQHHSSSAFLSCYCNRIKVQKQNVATLIRTRITGKLIVTQAIASLIDFFVNFIVLNMYIKLQLIRGPFERLVWMHLLLWAAIATASSFRDALNKHKQSVHTSDADKWIQLIIKSLIVLIIYLLYFFFCAINYISCKRKSLCQPVTLRTSVNFAFTS